MTRKQIVLDNLEDIARLTAFEEGWNDVERQQVLIDYKEYLHAASEGLAGQPSLKVDALWHKHILHTEVYERDTATWFGKFIHHRACVPDELESIFEGDGAPRKTISGPDKAGCGPGGPGIANIAESKRSSDLANCGPGKPVFFAGSHGACGLDEPKQTASCGSPSPSPSSDLIAACGPGDLPD